MSPIGLKAKFLNSPFSYRDGKENQLLHWNRLGLLTKLPDDLTAIPRAPNWMDPSDGTLEQRAKAYLDINCAHCHRPGGRAGSTGLFLDYERAPDNQNAGMCKPPVAAGAGSGGRSFDIVPGQADQSILMVRLGSNDLAVRMPEEGRSVPHRKGNELIRNWVDSLPRKDCRIGD
jgi:hypothetical protein